jgi:hypothetical protein
MTIKYGEIFVKHNVENVWTSTIFWLGYDEQIVSEDSTIIVKFEDGDIQEVSNELSSDKIVKIEFCVNGAYNPPSYFIIKCDDKEHMYFTRKPKDKNGEYGLSFKDIFTNYEHYDDNNNLPSYFNCIYFKNKLVDTTVKEMDVFAILRIKSNVSSPRYQIVYDSDHFSKDIILYLINYIFRQPSQSKLAIF